jgi:hypothetical protein
MPDMMPAPTAQSVTLRQELRAVVALSGPLALSNLAQIAMGTTDVMMMGRLGPDTLAAGGFCQRSRQCPVRSSAVRLRYRLSLAGRAMDAVYGMRLVCRFRAV